MNKLVHLLGFIHDSWLRRKLNMTREFYWKVNVIHEFMKLCKARFDILKYTWTLKFLFWCCCCFFPITWKPQDFNKPCTQDEKLENFPFISVTRELIFWKFASNNLPVLFQLELFPTNSRGAFQFVSVNSWPMIFWKTQKHINIFWYDTHSVFCTLRSLRWHHDKISDQLPWMV